MKHWFLIRVCKKDILNGQPDSADSCPIGLALQRQLAIPPEQLEVSENWVRIIYDRISFPQKVRDFIHKWDKMITAHNGVGFHREKHFKPFNFALDMRKRAMPGRPKKL